MVSAMSDDDKKATEGTGEKATNGAAKATSAADEAGTLKHIGGSQSDAWNDARVATDHHMIRVSIGHSPRVPWLHRIKKSRRGNRTSTL
jgi:hypothetical protein